MFKPNLEQVEDFLELLAYECPEEVYGELANFQPDCHSVEAVMIVGIQQFLGIKLNKV